MVPKPPTRDVPAARDLRIDVPHELDDLLWRVTAYTHVMEEAALADTPLTVASGTTLTIILEDPGLSVAEISRQIPKAQQTISQLAGRLEKLGLVERRLRSGRGIGLFVTDAGLEMAQVVLARQRDVLAQVRELIGDERADTLTALLRETHEILRETA